MTVPLLIWTLVSAAAAWPQEQSEFRTRRDSLMTRLPRHLLVVRTSELLADVTVPNRVPDPNFYYLTGHPNALGAVLVLDGPARQSWLFLPAHYSGFAAYLSSKGVAVSDSVTNTGEFHRVVELDEFVPFLRRRFREDSTLALLLATPGFSELLRPVTGPPAGLGPASDPRHPWLTALSAALPGRRIALDTVLLDSMRVRKSAGEIALLGRAGAASASALRSGITAVRPGRRQREVEAAVVTACLKEGSGVAFWPWAMSGPNSVYPVPWRGRADVGGLDRVMQSGELVRLDVGCAVGAYMGDVGRTVPVSGRFTPEQREIWGLMVRAYTAGLAAIRAGVPVADVIAASLRAVERMRDSLKSPLARQAAAAILDGTGSDAWQLHGVGLDPGEPLPPVLREGMVLAHEPILAVAGLGFYLEDMLVVTSEGFELLTPGLPTTADELERFMAERAVDAGIQVPQPNQIVAFTPDPPPADGPPQFAALDVTRVDLSLILTTHALVSRDDWYRRFSHVAGGDRTGTFTLRSGAVVRWLVRPGGLARLTMPDGTEVHLALSSGLSPADLRIRATRHRDDWVSRTRPEDARWLLQGSIASVERTAEGWHVTFETKTGGAADSPEGLHVYYLHVYLDPTGEVARIERGPDVVS